MALLIAFLQLWLETVLFLQNTIVWTENNFEILNLYVTRIINKLIFTNARNSFYKAKHLFTRHQQFSNSSPQKRFLGNQFLFVLGS